MLVGHLGPVWQDGPSLPRKLLPAWAKGQFSPKNSYNYYEYILNLWFFLGLTVWPTTIISNLQTLNSDYWERYSQSPKMFIWKKIGDLFVHDETIWDTSISNRMVLLKRWWILFFGFPKIAKTRGWYPSGADVVGARFFHQLPLGPGPAGPDWETLGARCGKTWTAPVPWKHDVLRHQLDPITVYIWVNYYDPTVLPHLKS